MIYSAEGLLDRKFNVLDKTTTETYMRKVEREHNIFDKQYYKPNNNFFISIIPMKQYILLRKTHETNQRITKWVQNSMQTTAIGVFACLALGLLVNSLCYGLALVMPIYMYFNKIRFVNAGFKQWRFDRNVQFSKFVRLVIPYLKQTKTDLISLNTILTKVKPRLDDEQDRQLLSTLRGQMISNPGSIAPFQEYAENASGSDKSYVFMNMLYDIQGGATNMNVIERLGRDSAEELTNNINTVIKKKAHKFVFIPTRMTMYSMIYILGFAVAYLVYSIQGFHF